ncbi:hypothetical protein BVC80_8999g34 [Macleaya cordata]|uniref:Uncharacterized protein n=1 Tax=Macleaya cordata TaxID=56857 RepID=A0A200Q5E9_MACCD|nr:hypothetical protein BVC80_8999g34 [Macleaya cordata]
MDNLTQNIFTNSPTKVHVTKSSNLVVDLNMNTSISKDLEDNDFKESKKEEIPVLHTAKDALKNVGKLEQPNTGS